MTITGAAYTAHNIRTTCWLAQSNRSLPYGDMPAMAAAARLEGATVTQCYDDMCMIDGIAWMNKFGAVWPIR